MSSGKMDSISTHIVMDEDLFEAAHQEAEKREITFSELYRRALKAELKYPSLVAEVRELRQRVDEIEDTLTAAMAATNVCIEDNREFIDEILRILEEINKRSRR